MTKRTRSPIHSVGFVGCGAIARDHLTAVRRFLPKVKLSFCDLDVEKARDMARRCAESGTQSDAYGDLSEMLASEELDAVHVLTSSQSHYRLTKQALMRGCHVLVEKPFVESSEEARELYDLAERQGSVLEVDHVLLGTPIVMRMEEEIAAGRFGRLLSAHCDFGVARKGLIPYDLGHWAYTMRGGVLANNASHPLSLLVRLMDPIVDYRVSALQRSYLPTPWPDLMTVVLESEDQLGSFSMTAGHGNADRRAHLLFERGSVTLDFTRQLYSSVTGQWPHNVVKKTLSGVSEGVGMALGTVSNIWNVVSGRIPKSNTGLVKVTERFYQTIQEGREPLVGKKNAREVTRLMEGIWNAIEESGFSGPGGVDVGEVPAREPQSSESTPKWATGPAQKQNMEAL